MRVYRVCSARHPHLDGEGARLYGGRWNSPGIPVVYTSSSLALAMIETRVHLRTPPVDYIRLTIEIPDTAPDSAEIRLASLDPAWRTETSVTRAAGDNHFRSTPLVALRVPSVAVDTEWNLLFHPDWGASHASVVNVAPAGMDPRLWD
jgi:RES domain-containing protein